MIENIRADVTNRGHCWITQNVLAYEVRMSTRQPDEKFRRNHIVMSLAETVQDAIAMCLEHYPDDPIIHQVVLRNRGMDLVFDRVILE